MRKHLLIALSTAALTSTTAFAQTPPTNLEKLGAFKTTGASPNIPTIPQTGPKADAVKKHLQTIKLPQGFHIGLYALVPDARHMAVGPQGIVTFVGTRKAHVYAVTDRGKTGVAEEVKAAFLTAAKPSPGSGSKSNTSRVGRSMSSISEPQMWNSSVPTCTPAITPANPSM